MTRYHPILVSLHWILAVMIIFGLVIGGTLLVQIPNDDLFKLTALQGHMAIGFLILVLMLFRLVVRLRSTKPPRADAGIPLLNGVAVVVHWALYATVIALAGSGIALSIVAGLPAIVFGGSGESLPIDFFAFPPRVVHGILANVLAVLILAHIAGFLFHRFVRRDGLFKRMWFGDRSA